MTRLKREGWRGGKASARQEDREYRETLAYLYNLEGRGMRFGLRAIRTLLAAAGHPERAFPSLHIAGTNGKGSTASFLASASMEAGLRTGLYTSPHLLRFTERIRIDGVELSEKRLVYYVRVLRPAIEATRATFFEATTCIAFLYFADEGVDLAVVETGLGGRLDATNTIEPLVSIITNVGVEHTEYLGSTLYAIAGEKGGIIKPHVPIVTGAAYAVVVRRLRSIARRKRAPFFVTNDLVHVVPGDGRKERVTLSVAGRSIGSVTLGLQGAHQLANAALAAAACELVRRSRVAARAGVRIPRTALLRGFAKVRRNTKLRGRLEQVRIQGDTVYLDVAHNPDGIRTLAAEIGQHSKRPAVALFGVMRDKDYPSMLRHLRGVAGTIVVVAPRTSRALPARKLYDAARKVERNVTYGGTVARGIRVARRKAKGEPILITGSHYVVAEALAALRGAREFT